MAQRRKASSTPPIAPNVQNPNDALLRVGLEADTEWEHEPDALDAAARLSHSIGMPLQLVIDLVRDCGDRLAESGISLRP
jgi:hypothetical protein